MQRQSRNVFGLRYRDLVALTSEPRPQAPPQQPARVFIPPPPTGPSPPLPAQGGSGNQQPPRPPREGWAWRQIEPLESLLVEGPQPPTWEEYPILSGSGKKRSHEEAEYDALALANPAAAAMQAQQALAPSSIGEPVPVPMMVTVEQQQQQQEPQFTDSDRIALERMMAQLDAEQAALTREQMTKQIAKATTISRIIDLDRDHRNNLSWEDLTRPVPGASAANVPPLLQRPGPPGTMQFASTVDPELAKLGKRRAGRVMIGSDFMGKLAATEQMANPQVTGLQSGIDPINRLKMFFRNGTPQQNEALKRLIASVESEVKAGNPNRKALLQAEIDKLTKPGQEARRERDAGDAERDAEYASKLSAIQRRKAELLAQVSSGTANITRAANVMQRKTQGFVNKMRATAQELRVLNQRLVDKFNRLLQLEQDGRIIPEKKDIFRRQLDDIEKQIADNTAEIASASAEKVIGPIDRVHEIMRQRRKAEDAANAQLAAAERAKRASEIAARQFSMETEGAGLLLPQPPEAEDPSSSSASAFATAQQQPAPSMFAPNRDQRLQNLTGLSAEYIAKKRGNTLRAGNGLPANNLAATLDALVKVKGFFSAPSPNMVEQIKIVIRDLEVNSNNLPGRIQELVVRDAVQFRLDDERRAAAPSAMEGIISAQSAAAAAASAAEAEAILARQQLLQQQQQAAAPVLAEDIRQELPPSFDTFPDAAPQEALYVDDWNAVPQILFEGIGEEFNLAPPVQLRDSLADVPAVPAAVATTAAQQQVVEEALEQAKEIRQAQQEPDQQHDYDYVLLFPNPPPAMLPRNDIDMLMGERDMSTTAPSGVIFPPATRPVIIPVPPAVQVALPVPAPRQQQQRPRPQLQPPLSVQPPRPQMQPPQHLLQPQPRVVLPQPQPQPQQQQGRVVAPGANLAATAFANALFAARPK